MMPREFLEKVVRPNISEWEANFGSERHAYNPVAAVDSLTAHLYVWCKANAPAEIVGISDDSQYRASLARRSPDFGLLRDIAKALKHVQLTSGKPQVANAGQVTTRSLGWCEERLGEGRWGGPPQVVVTTDSETFATSSRSASTREAWVPALCGLATSRWMHFINWRKELQ
jgi:hypothetical protein